MSLIKRETTSSDHRFCLKDDEMCTSMYNNMVDRSFHPREKNNGENQESSPELVRKMPQLVSEVGTASDMKLAEGSDDSENGDLPTKPRLFSDLSSRFLEGFGFVDKAADNVEDDTIPSIVRSDSDRGVHDSLMMDAELLISNPYKNTTSKYNELKDLEQKAAQIYEQDNIIHAARRGSNASLLRIPTGHLGPISEGDSEGSLQDDSERNDNLIAQYSNKFENETSMRLMSPKVSPHQGICVQEISQNGGIVYLNAISLDSLYDRLKRDCRHLDQRQPALKSNDTSKFTKRRSLHRDASLATFRKRGLTRLFGSGRIDGTKDFVRMNFPLSVELLLNSSQHCDLSGRTKSTIFFRRHSIWISLNCEEYPIRAIIMADKVYVFIPSDGSVSNDLGSKFQKEIVQPLIQLIEGRLPVQPALGKFNGVLSTELFFKNRRHLSNITQAD
jgi:hypothetical protein